MGNFKRFLSLLLACALSELCGEGAGKWMLSASLGKEAAKSGSKGKGAMQTWGHRCDQSHICGKWHLYVITDCSIVGGRNNWDSHQEEWAKWMTMSTFGSNLQLKKMMKNSSMYDWENPDGRLLTTKSQTSDSVYVVCFYAKEQGRNKNLNIYIYIK